MSRETAVAAYAYSSPDVPGLLVFDVGNIITITRRINDEWAEGYVGHSTERVNIPLSYVNFASSATSGTTTYTAENVLLPSAPVRHERRQRPHGRKVEQLSKELNEHLIASLTDGVMKTQIMRCIEAQLARHQKEDVSDAIEYAAKKFSLEVHNRLEHHLVFGIEEVMSRSWRETLTTEPLYTPEDYSGFLHTFTDVHLSVFFGRNSRKIQAVAEKAASVVQRDPGMTPELLSGVAKLALYDFVFLCGT